MLTLTGAISGFSVNDLEAAREFYGTTLGLTVADGGMGNLSLVLPAGAVVLIYPKPNHEPATYTILNFQVADVDTAVDELTAAGVEMLVYDFEGGLKTDSRGVAKGWGPDIAWFTDPAGNILSVLKP